MSSFETRRQLKSLQHWVLVLSFIGLLCTLFVAVYGRIVTPRYDFFDEYAREYTEEWYWDDPNGETVTLTLPGQVPTEKGVPVTLYTYLPDDIKEDTYMCIHTARDFDVYINNELRFSFDGTEGDILGGAVKAIYVPIEIGPADEGAQFAVTKKSLDETNGSMNTILIGDLHGIYKYVSREYATQMVSAIILAILSLLVFGVFCGISMMQKKILPLVYLSLGILMCSLWVINDNNLFQFITEKYYVDGVVGYMLTTLLILPFCFYLDIIQDGHYRRFYNIIEIVALISAIVVGILHFSHIIHYDDMLTYIDLMLILGIVAILAIGIYDFHRVRIFWKKHFFISLGMISLIICSVLEIVFINIYVARNFQVGGIFVVIGLYVVLLCATMDQVNNLREITIRSQEAIASTKAKSEFLANMSHEIRTPINAIMGMNEMILRESKDEDIISYAQDIHTASVNLLEIVNDILDFSKIESGKMEIEPEEYNVGELIASCETMIGIKANQKGLKFRVEALDEIPSVLYGDTKRITEVMINILNNAVKYTRRGFIVLNVSYIARKRNEIDLVFYVRDTGIGIRDEDLDRLFGTFERLEYKKNRNIEGSGLGLAITEKLVHMMDGTITVESLHGCGSKFTVTIPQIVVDNTPMGEYKSHKNTSVAEEKNWGTFTAPTCRVLIVDDNHMNLTVTSKLLAKTGMKIDTAISGFDMLKLIKTNKYDVILLDHMMPEMDGIETLHKAKEMPDNMSSDAAYIALTANAIVGAKEIYMNAGFDNYLSKPVEPASLEKMLVAYLPPDRVLLS